MEKELLSAKELAIMIGQSQKFVYKHIAARRLPGMVRVGRNWKFVKSEVRKRILTGTLLLPAKNKAA